MFILCTIEGNILNFNHEFCKLTEYKINDLYFKFIGILMNDLLSFLHKQFFIPKMKYSDEIDKIILMHKLLNKTLMRPFIIYNKYNNPIYANIHIMEITSELLAQLFNNFNMILDLNHVSLLKEKYIIITLDKIYDSIEITNFINEYQLNNIILPDNDFLNKKNTFTDIQETKNNIVIISIDRINKSEEPFTSNKFIKRNSLLYEDHYNFYDDVLFIIKSYFYPFIYIYENMGDSFIFILNIDWMYNISIFCSTIALSFIQLFNY